MWKQSLTFTSMIVIYLSLYSTSHSFNHYQSHLKLLLNIIFDCVHPTTQRAPVTITVPQHQQTASYRLSRHLFFCGTSKIEATTRPFYQINIFLGDLNISSTTGFFLFLLFSSKKKRKRKGKLDQCFRSVKYALKELLLISFQLNMHQINAQLHIGLESYTFRLLFVSFSSYWYSPESSRLKQYKCRYKTHLVLFISRSLLLVTFCLVFCRKLVEILPHR